MKRISIFFFGLLLAAFVARGQSFYLLVGTYTNSGNLAAPYVPSVISRS